MNSCKYRLHKGESYRSIFVRKIYFGVLCACLACMLASCSLQGPRGGLGEVKGTKEKGGPPDLLAPRQGEVKRLPEIELIHTPEVDRQIDYYRREQYTIQAGLKNRRRYDRMLKEIFRDEGVPPSLINLALIESRFEPGRKSGGGAVGMWQFMKDTGRLYGLEIGWFEDQREDPILSSIAAARHLYDLYLKYNDWYLVVAAYNRGTGGIDAAMKKSGAGTFLDLVRAKALSMENATFVYRFVAVCFIMNDLQRYGFAPSSERMAGGTSDWSRY